MDKYLLFMLATSTASLLAGRKNNVTLDRIINASNNVIKSYPYATYLDLQNRGSTCSASLIMSQVIITSASCIGRDRSLDTNRIIAFLGSNVPKYSKMVRRVVDSRLHPNYDEHRLRNNIALGYFNRRVVFSSKVAKIPLAVAEPADAHYTGEVVGWGQQPSQKLDYPKMHSLKRSKQRMLSSNECRRRIDKKSDNILCSTRLEEHFFQGDGGAGLIVREPTMVLVGVLSHVVDDVAVYSSIIPDAKWIYYTSVSMFDEICTIEEPKEELRCSSDHDCSFKDKT